MAADQDSSPNVSSPHATRNPLVEALLLDRFPFHSLAAGLATYIGPAGAAPSHALLESERRRLLALPPEELTRLHKALLTRQRAEREVQANNRAAKAAAKAAAHEAAKFYNIPAAAADFDYWSKAEYWTFDESVALLLGKEPTVVTWAAVKAEKAAFSLASLGAPQPCAEFVRRYEELRNLAMRATVMTSTLRLGPAAVVLWATQSGAAQATPRLIQLLQARAQTRKALPPLPAPCAPDLPPNAPQNAQAPVNAVSTPAVASLSLKRIALVNEYRAVWRTIERDLAHASENGLASAAKGDKHGVWLVEPALAWARQNGKVVQAGIGERASPFPTASRTVHRLRDT